MIDAAICDGDWVVVRQQPEVNNGEIVAAMIDGEPTVKVFSYRDGHAWLLPRNPSSTRSPRTRQRCSGKSSACCGDSESAPSVAPLWTMNLVLAHARGALPSTNVTTRPFPATSVTRGRFSVENDHGVTFMATDGPTVTLVIHPSWLEVRPNRWLIDTDRTCPSQRSIYEPDPYTVPDRRGSASGSSVPPAPYTVPREGGSGLDTPDPP